MGRQLRKTSILSLIIVVVLTVTPCLASVTGTVNDTSGSPVSGALVTFADESNLWHTLSTYTNSAGTYIINLPVFTLQPPSNLINSDVPNDNGHAISLSWDKSPDEDWGKIDWYRILRSQSAILTSPTPLTDFESLESLIEAEKHTTILIDSVAVGTTQYTSVLPEANVTYYFWIQAIGKSGVSKKVSASLITHVDTKEYPQSFQLEQNYPNPFNPSTTIPFSLNEAGFVNLIIYNITGQKVRTLINNYHSVGSHTVTWNGLDDSGKSSAAGIYIYQLRFGDTVESRKMLLIDGGSSGSVRRSNQIFTRTNSLSKSVSTTENSTYLVTITGDSIEPYEESGITNVDEGIYNFVVLRVAEYNDITFVTIPAVTTPYEMAPGYTVTLSAYRMSVTEVTNAQYTKYLTDTLASGDIEVTSGGVYGKTGEWSGQRYLDIRYSYNSDNKCWIHHSDGIFGVASGKENWPVVAVTWPGSKAFAEYYGLDLPTEAEWQYAASGGMSYEYGTDDGTINSLKANYDRKDYYPTAGGSYPANPFGLYDMSGNVWEWCSDWYGGYPKGSVNNPTGVQSGSYHVIRGGSWYYNVIYCRSTFRGFYSLYCPYGRSDVMGFRVVSR